MPRTWQHLIIMRSPRQKTPRRCTLSIPLTPEQREDLDWRAGRKPVSTYVRERLFAANDNGPHAKATRRSAPTKETARALAALGPTAHALRSLAQGIASGVVPVSPDTEAAIRKAYGDIAALKALLMKALRIREG